MRSGAWARPASLNPLNVTSTSLPPNVLFAAKLITAAFLVSGQWSLLPDIFLPFVRAFDDFPSSGTFEWLLKVIFLVGALCLFLNLSVRLACGVLGTTILVGMMGSRIYFENNRTFTACVLLLAALSDRRLGSLLIRLQLVVLYVAAAANKLLDADWRSGAFFEAWNSIQGYRHVYESVASVFPKMLFSQSMSWAVIVTEFFLAVAFAWRPLVPVGAVVGAAYHSSLLVVTGRTFGMFWFALLGAYLAVLDRPEITEKVRFTTDRGTYGKREALERLLLHNPAPYAALAILVAAPQPDRRWGGLVVLAACAYATARLIGRARREPSPRPA